MLGGPNSHDVLGSSPGHSADKLSMSIAFFFFFFFCFNKTLGKGKSSKNGFILVLSEGTVHHGGRRLRWLATFHPLSGS